jgi:hypothetical protein
MEPLKDKRPYLLANMTEFGKTEMIPLKRFGELGYDLVIYPVSTLRIAMGAVTRYHIVPFRDEIVQRAAEGLAFYKQSRLAERHAAVHAARPLLFPYALRQGNVEFIPVPHPLQRRTARFVCAVVFKKSCGFSHFSVPPYALVQAAKASSSACSRDIPCSSKFSIALSILS